MIALISFPEDIITTKEIAEKLNLQYKEGNIGYSTYYNKQKLLDNPNDRFIEDLEKRVDPEKEDKVDYYNEMGKKVDSYYLHTKVENSSNLVQLKKENQLVNLEEFATTSPFKFLIEKVLKTETPTIPNIQFLLNRLEEKALEVNKTLDILQQTTFNQKVNVHVGGGLIATYNDLCLKEDSCTDLIQTELNNGWRIIAVCVQPNQRRPDYILGRYNPKLEVSEKDSASR